MITVERTDRYSISFYFKIECRNDVKKTIDTFERAIKNQEIIENCILKVDTKIFKARKKCYREMKLLVNLGEGVIGEDNDYFILELSRDDLEYGIDLLKGYVNTGFFEVAEFTKVARSNVKWLTQIYFISRS